MRWAVKICWAQAIKLFMFKPATQIGAICFKTGKCLKRSGFFCSESELPQSKHGQWAQQRGVYMTTVHVDTTVTLWCRRCETSSGSRLTSTSWPPCCQSHERRQTCPLKAKQRTNEATNCWKKRNQTGKKGENRQGAGTRGFDTQTQSQSSWANTAVGLVLLSGVLWQRIGFVRQGARAGTWG